MPHRIPNDVKLFILNHIDSIAQLEGLLMLRSDPQRTWNAESMARELYIDQERATALLAHLTEQGFLVEAAPPLSYRYQPQTAELKEKTEILAGLYRRHLVQISNLVHSKRHKVQGFANAFRIRKE